MYKIYDFNVIMKRDYFIDIKSRDIIIRLMINNYCNWLFYKYIYHIRNSIVL